VSIINFSIYTLALSLAFSLISLIVPAMGWDWIAVNTCSLLLVVGVMAVSRTLWDKYRVLLFWGWAGFLLALAGAYASNVVNYFLSR
jgi:hypothetical protein